MVIPVDQYVLSAVKGVAVESKAGFMVYSPYWQYQCGSYTVDFFLRAPTPTGKMATVEVHNANNGQFLAQKAVQASDLAGNNAWSRISLPITVTDANNRLAFSVYWHGTANLDVATQRVRESTDASFLGRMPAGQHPVTAYQERIGIVTQLQGNDGSTANGGQSNHTQTVTAPTKVVCPVLRTWIKERNNGVCFRIYSGDFISLVPITDRTCQPKVDFIICSTFRKRNDMLHFKARHHKMLWAEAIPTPLQRGATNTLINVSRDTPASHRMR